MNNNWRLAAAIILLASTTASANPVGWWKFDEAAGTTATDSSGSGYNGIFVNPPATWVAGKIGGAVSFNGTNQYFSFGDNLDLIGSDLSLSIWVRPTVVSSSMPLLDKLSSGGNYRIFGNLDGSVAYGIRNTAGSFQQILSAVGKLSAGTWTHIGVVHRNADNHGTLYINGVSAGTAMFTIVRGNTANALISGHSSNNGTYYNGAVDDMRVYDRALSAAEVQSLYDSGFLLPPEGDTEPVAEHQCH